MTLTALVPRLLRRGPYCFCETSAPEPGLEGSATFADNQDLFVDLRMQFYLKYEYNAASNKWEYTRSAPWTDVYYYATSFIYNNKLFMTGGKSDEANLRYYVPN